MSGCLCCREVRKVVVTGGVIEKGMFVIGLSHDNFGRRHGRGSFVRVIKR